MAIQRQLLIFSVLKLNRNAPERRSVTFMNAGTQYRHCLPIQLFQVKISNQTFCHQMRFSSSKYTKMRLLEQLTALPRPLVSGSRFATGEGTGEGNKGEKRGEEKGKLGKVEGSIPALLFFTIQPLDILFYFILFRTVSTLCITYYVRVYIFYISRQ